MLSSLSFVGHADRIAPGKKIKINKIKYKIFEIKT